jgi:hypothetical protein
MRALGIASVVLAALAMVLVVPALLAVPFSVIVAAHARRDLGKMAAGLMDPAGRDMTKAAWNRAVFAVVLCLLAIPVGIFALWPVVVRRMGW